jgi:hypothetical protein
MARLRRGRRELTTRARVGVPVRAAGLGADGHGRAAVESPPDGGHPLLRSAVDPGWTTYPVWLRRPVVVCLTLIRLCHVADQCLWPDVGQSSGSVAGAYGR